MSGLEKFSLIFAVVLDTFCDFFMQFAAFITASHRFFFGMSLSIISFICPAMLEFLSNIWVPKTLIRNFESMHPS